MAEKTITYTVENYIPERNTFTVKVYCNLFKNPKESYPSHNINLLNIDANKDVQKQIEIQCFRIVERILLEENEDMKTLAKTFIDTNIGKQMTLSDPANDLVNSEVFEVIN